jgi:hypothetical protein
MVGSDWQRGHPVNIVPVKMQVMSACDIDQEASLATIEDVQA